MDRTGNDWIQKRKKQFEETGFKSLFLDINEDDDEIILKVQNFIHNGLKVTNIKIIKNLKKLTFPAFVLFMNLIIVFVWMIRIVSACLI